MKINILLPCFFAVLFFACSKKEVMEESISFEEPARMQVQVQRCLDAACTQLEQVPGASVFVFEHEHYRSQGSPIAAEGTTDGGGTHTFGNLTAAEHWLTVKMPQPDGRSKLAYAKTPLRTTSYVNVVFKKQ